MPHRRLSHLILWFKRASLLLALFSKAKIKTLVDLNKLFFHWSWDVACLFYRDITNETSVKLEEDGIQVNLILFPELASDDLSSFIPVGTHSRIIPHSHHVAFQL